MKGKGLPIVLFIACVVLAACTVFLGRRTVQEQQRAGQLEERVGETERALENKERNLDAWRTRASETAAILGIGLDEMEDGKFAPLSKPHLALLEKYLEQMHGHLDPPLPAQRRTVWGILREMARQRDTYDAMSKEYRLEIETRDRGIEDERERNRRRLQEKDDRIAWLSKNVPLMEKETLALKGKNAELLGENSRLFREVARLKAEIEGSKGEKH